MDKEYLNGSHVMEDEDQGIAVQTQKTDKANLFAPYRTYELAHDNSKAEEYKEAAKEQMQYMRVGGAYELVPKGMETVDTLENGGVYSVQFSMFKGFYLVRKPNFTLPPKVYGNVVDRTDRVLSKFSKATSNIGVLLSGLKGTGKSLLAKYICIKSNLPIILMDNEFDEGMLQGYLDFLTNVALLQEVVLFFDEFEKVFSADAQEKLLSFMEDTTSTKSLLLFTCNAIGKINENMLARPGRVLYKWNYLGLELETIREVVEDRLSDRAKIESAMAVFELINEFSYVTMDQVDKFILEIESFLTIDPKNLLDGLNIMAHSNVQHRKDFLMSLTYNGMPILNGVPTNINVMGFNGQVRCDNFITSYDMYESLGSDDLEKFLDDLTPEESKELKIIQFFNQNAGKFYSYKTRAAYLSSIGFTEEQIDDTDFDTYNLTFNHFTSADAKIDFSSNRIVMQRGNLVATLVVAPKVERAMFNAFSFEV